MSFSVPPSRVPARSAVPVVGMIAAAALIVAAGVFGRDGSPAATVSPSVASPPPVVSEHHRDTVPLQPRTVPPPGVGSGSIAAPPGSDRLIPVEMPPVSSCDGGNEAWCRQLLHAALLALVEGGASDADLGAIVSASVWHSLVCDVPLDCPRDRLVRSTPVGSVVLEFVDGGPRAWINVVRPIVPLPGSHSLELEAWVARFG